MRLLFLFSLLFFASCSNQQMILLDPDDYVDKISSKKLGPYCSNHADTVTKVLQIYGVKTARDERNRILIDKKSAEDRHLIMNVLIKSIDSQWLRSHEYLLRDNVPSEKK